MRLPDSFWCYDPVNGLDPAVNELPALAAGRVTFGCLNNFCKVNDGVLHLWAAVLNEVPGSRLLLSATEGDHRRRVTATLGREGIAADRVEFVAPVPHLDYLRTYHRIDICLDTSPYNGHTTTLDGLWMGVPVVTLVGRTVVGRAGLSQLTNLGLESLVAYTSEQFVAAAAGLAGDLPRLGELRSTLRTRVRRSPLGNSVRFTRDIEAAYRNAWREVVACPRA